MYKDDIFYIVLKLFIAVFMLVTIIVVVWPFWDAQFKLFKKRQIERIELYSVDTGDKLSGHFSLGCGRIEETDYYCCYRILEDGGKKYYKFEMDKTTIYETLESGEQAYVDVSKNGFGMVVSYSLYVPKDSIIKEIDLSIPK